jgi:hypothetical protein
LRILAENRAERPHGTALATGEPSDREKVAWERVMATRELTVYLAEDNTEVAGTAVTGELSSTVHHAFEPAHVSIWSARGTGTR